ncbi:hypothetical protein GCM10023205_71180 [Yinghuangia aomiensis]|uniref:Condensation domain-containing protein n=1 Tax=Yinghuangia aomiensis TaxID=676205 RepID=A0ABP9I6X2_9ACTN
MILHHLVLDTPSLATLACSLARSDHRLHREVMDEDRRLTVHRDAERAAAFAEPVRPIAEATTSARGVPYHRLSNTSSNGSGAS